MKPMLTKCCISNEHFIYIRSTQLPHASPAQVWRTLRQSPLEVDSYESLDPKEKEARAFVFDSLREQFKTCVVLEKTPKDQKPFTYTNGFLWMHCHGIAKGISQEYPHEWCILHVRSCNTEEFRKLGCQGKIPAGDYAHLQLSMGTSGMTHACLVTYCPETDEGSIAHIVFDADKYEEYLHWAEKMAMESQLPACEPVYRFEQELPFQMPSNECRSCYFSRPRSSAQWVCKLQNCQIPFSELELGCQWHLYHPDLIPFAQLVEKNLGHTVLLKEVYYDIMENNASVITILQ